MNDATEILKLILDLGPDATTAVRVASLWQAGEVVGLEPLNLQPCRGSAGYI